ncbi:DinB superfamily protein [Halpernia sp. GG3]
MQIQFYNNFNNLKVVEYLAQYFISLSNKNYLKTCRKKMLTENLNKLFIRDLDGLINELNLYKNENNLWTVHGDITNSAGNLALHLVGNLQHFIGKELGGTNYVRTREREFSLKNVSRETIIKQIEDTKIIVNKTLKTLDTNKLQDQYPILAF